MPWPVLRYHEPDGAIPACFQSLSSLALVPESSARDANRALILAIACMAGSMPPASAVLAGSDGGPTSTKSLCITALRVEPWPCCMNFVSASGECTSSTSAWPRAPRSSACPDPTATVLTPHLVAFSKEGTNVSSSPLSRVLVVVPRIIWRLGGVGVDELEPEPQPPAATIAATRT